MTDAMGVRRCTANGRNGRLLVADVWGLSLFDGVSICVLMGTVHLLGRLETVFF